MLKWARANGCEWEPIGFFHATAEGPCSKEVLEWALANGLPLPIDACLIAAGTGNIAVLACARAHGGRWDACVSYAAARHGHLTALKYLLENGCECDVSQLRTDLENILSSPPLNTSDCDFEEPKMTAEERKQIELTLQWLKDLKKML